MELVDTPVSGTGAREGMGVRVSRRVVYSRLYHAIIVETQLPVVVAGSFLFPPAVQMK